MPTHAVVDAFRNAAEDDAVVEARFAVLSAAADTLGALADRMHIGGWLGSDDRALAAALLTRLGSDLVSGIEQLLRAKNTYAAGALLRQLIEVEYLLFLGYANLGSLAEWYRASEKDLRKQFSPQQMRNKTDGLFRDEEYWQHCKMGGHPHPAARMLLSAYPNTLDPIAVVLPDTVQHVRRLWTSVRLLLPQLDSAHVPEGEHEPTAVDAAIGTWIAQEDPLIASLDGIPVGSYPR